MTWRKTAAYWIVALFLGGYWFVLRGVEPEAAGEKSSVARDKVLNVFLDEIRAVEIQRGGAVVRAEKNERWAVVAPEGIQVPSDLVSALLSTLADKQEGEIVSQRPTAEDLEAFGLTPPAQKIAVELEGGRVVVAEVGTRNPTRTAVYTRRAGSQPVILSGLNVQYYSDLLFQAAYPGGVPVEN